MTRNFIIGLLCALPLFCSAQTLTLDSCISLAKQNNPDIQTARLDIEHAKAVKQQIFSKYFPQVSGGFVAYHALHDLVGVSPTAVRKSGKEDLADMLQSLLDSYNEANGTSESELGLMRHGLTVNATALQPIFAGGRIVNGNRLAKLGVEAAELKAEVSERDVVEDVESDFYLVVGLEQKVSTLESALSLLDSIDKTAQIAYEAGVVTRSDLLQVSLKRNELLAKDQQLSSGIVLARKLLCLKIGVPYSESIVFLDQEEDATLPAASSEYVRPEQQLLQLNLRAEQLRKKLTIGEALPQVALGATYFYGDLVTNGTLLEHSVYQGNGLLFLSASIPLTAWWETGCKIRQQNIRIQQAELKQQNLGSMMTLQEEKAYSDWKQAAALIRSDSTALEVAQENYRLSLLNYQAGTQTLNDVLQANTMLLQAQNAITDRHITLVEARRRYHDLTGR